MRGKADFKAPVITTLPPAGGSCTHPVLLFQLQLLDALQQALAGTVQVVGQARDGDYVTLQLRRRHLNVHLVGEGNAN